MVRGEEGGARVKVLFKCLCFKCYLEGGGGVYK